MSDPQLGPVALTVSDLDRSVAWWGRLVGLRAAPGGEGVAELSAGGGPLVVLHEEPGARPARGHPGLFHVALLVPGRGDLGRWLARARDAGDELTGASDHGVSVALDLRDPDQHGLELYWDRPREEWPISGEVVEMRSDPLDLVDLLGAATEGPPGLPAGTRVGHVHLCVPEVEPAERFYAEGLELRRTARIGDQATFLAWDGYHHHVGANVWESRGAPPPPPGSAALRDATLRYPSAGARDAAAARAEALGSVPEPDGDDVLVRDPSGNRLRLAV